MVRDNSLKLALCILNVLNLIAAILSIAAGSVAINQTGKTEMEHDHYGAAIIVLISAAVVFILTVLGCYGSLHDSVPLLLGFSIGLLLIALLEFSAIVLAAILQVDAKENLRKDMEKAISKYTSGSRTDFWDRIHVAHRCCGVDDFNDWITSGQSMPRSCCYEKIAGTTETEHEACKSFPKRRYLYKDGCYSIFRKEMILATDLVMYGGVITCLIKSAAVIAGFILAVRIRRELREGH